MPQRGAGMPAGRSQGRLPGLRPKHAAAILRRPAAALDPAPWGASSGGGIFNKGTLAAMSSTFSGNLATNGGGIYNFRDATITTIANSTFSGNSATSSGGGIYNYDGTITTIANSTFSGNSAVSSGGGIFNNGTISTTANTIIASSPLGGNCGGSAPTTSTNNLADSPGCSSWGWTNTLVPSSHLSPLADNGGGTYTFALLGAAALGNLREKLP